MNSSFLVHMYHPVFYQKKHEVVNWLFYNLLRNLPMREKKKKKKRKRRERKRKIKAKEIYSLQIHESIKFAIFHITISNGFAKTFAMIKSFSSVSTNIFIIILQALINSSQSVSKLLVTISLRPSCVDPPSPKTNAIKHRWLL